MNTNTKKIFSIFVVLLLILAGVVLYFEYIDQSEDEEEPEDERTYDDRINPYIYQGLTVEILRMRNRDLIDEIFKFGNSWKKSPEYYYVVEVDGEVGDASYLEAAGGATGEGTFTDWDIMLKECRTNFKTEDDQKTSDVKISIMEIKKSGLFGRRETSEEKLSIDLTYDFRTGRWTGDDYLKDNDGYGHVLGEDYEIWFNIYQSDYDHDYIPYWTEVNIYGTDPTVDDSKSDPDGDGIPSTWEWKWGYDPLTWDNHEKLDPDVDGVENIEEYMLAEYFADPFHPDVYIEVDFMVKNPNKLFDLEHIMYKESQQMIIEKLSTMGINAYFDDGWPDGPINGGGEYVEFVETIDEIVGGHMARWYKHNFADERKEVFRYFQVVYNAGIITPSEFNHYDHILMDSSPYKMYRKRLAFTPRLQRVSMAKGTLHELGHTMGIVPASFEGVDNIPQGNFQWPETLSDEEWARINEDYKSIMNYKYTFGHFKERKFFDFSDGSNGEYDFDDYAHFYLPTFQMDASILESPKIRDGTFDDFEWVDKDPDPIYSGWELDENLTEEFEQELSELRFDMDNAVEYYYRIYTKADEEQKGRDVRIYTKPNVKPIPSLWTLIGEGNIDSDEENLDLYSYEDQVEKVLEMI